MSKRCTQDLSVLNTQGSSTGFLFTYHSAIPDFFSGIVDFGLPFSINLLSPSAFLGFRKALEQDGMSSSVRETGKFLNTSEIWFSCIIISYVVFFSYANFQRIQKRHCYQLHWNTLFRECFWSRSIDQSRSLRGRGGGKGGRGKLPPWTCWARQIKSVDGFVSLDSVIMI